MPDTKFEFKMFSVAHLRSSMKVGVDAVCIGAWTELQGDKILEIGTGCGVISLILAQRYPSSLITAIDNDLASIEEASENFKSSPWHKHLSAQLIDFQKFIELNTEKVDLIISNPPYFNSGLKEPKTSRERARHQHTLSVHSLIQFSAKLLKNNGKLAFIIPTDYYDEAISTIKDSVFNLSRQCFIRYNEKKAWKRVMIELMINDIEMEYPVKTEYLTMFSDGQPTEDYRLLCKDFYLKF